MEGLSLEFRMRPMAVDTVVPLDKTLDIQTIFKPCAHSTAILSFQIVVNLSSPSSLRQACAA